MEKNLNTMAFSKDDLKKETVKEVLKSTKSALEERGYSAVNQLTGYLISGDPAYISSHKNARTIIQQVERYEIIEELVKAYLKENQ